jgi:SAM-dependent methyltransferase
MNSLDSFAVAMEDRNCPFGCEPADTLVCTGRDRFHDLPGEFRVVKCGTCGLQRTNPRPAPESMHLYYPDHYAPYRQSADAIRDMPRGVPRWKSLVGGLIRFNTKNIPKLPPGRMLEVGCSSGAFLHKMAGAGWDVEGVEFSPQAASAARSLGYRVYTGSLESAPDPVDTYDLVVGWMVLEHLHEPLAVLEKLRRWVRPGGWLVFSVPDVASWEFLLFRNSYYGLHLPNHLYHFEPATIDRLLRKTHWRTRRISHQRVIGSLFASFGFYLQDKGVNGRVINWLARIPTAGIAVNVLLYPFAFVMAALGQTGRMTVWAQRDD